jgi:ParB family chromosome partitioning protein
MTTPTQPARHSPAPPQAGQQRRDLSERLRRRRLAILPLVGPGAVWTDVQGRGPGETTRPAALADLISSISAWGVLHPVLVEQLPDPRVGQPPSLRLVFGERRLRACRWGQSEDPDNPHFHGLPALICPGPLSAEDIRSWQLIENLAREDQQPGELAASLLLCRCAMLATNLLHAGIPVPADAALLDDPVARWNALDQLRPATGPAANTGAPWEQLLRRLGLHLSERKARQLVEAFKTLPRDISADMDAHRISLTTRCAYARLYTGRADAAAGLWAAVKARGQPALLPRAVAELRADSHLDPDTALDRATTAALDANAARAVAVAAAHRPGEPAPGAATATPAAAEPQDAVCRPQVTESTVDRTGPHPSHRAGVDPTDTDTNDVTPANPQLTQAALAALTALLDHLRAGAVLPAYDAGSLRLLLDELTVVARLDLAAPRRGDGHRRSPRADRARSPG